YHQGGAAGGCPDAGPARADWRLGLLALAALSRGVPRFAWAGAAGLLVWGVALLVYQRPFVEGLVREDTGQEVIASVSSLPRNALEPPVFWMPWGTRYFAASYSRLVTAENADLRMVDHTADLSALVDAGYTLHTQPAVFFRYPLAWWEAQLGPLYPGAAGVDLVRLSQAPRRVQLDPARLRQPVVEGIWITGVEARCTAHFIDLFVGWYAEEAPTQDYSVLVHLLRAEDGPPLRQADAQRASVWPAPHHHLATQRAGAGSLPPATDARRRAGAPGDVSAGGARSFCQLRRNRLFCGRMV
ncbi:MAG: hypothetical protein HC915_10315, partial [Anaerolineae bacterium]|nr:hypothetical protein [Anaerolineae bacterium]